MSTSESGSCSPRTSALGELPQELALHVLSYLGPLDVCAIAALSRHWHKLSLDPSLWRSHYLRSQLYQRRQIRQRELHPNTAHQFLASSLDGEGLGRDWRGMYMEDCRVKRQWLAGGYVQQHTVRVPGSVYAIRFDEDKVVCGTQDSHIRVYDRKTWQNTLTFSGHRDWVGAVQYDDDKLVSCSGDMDVRVWNWEGRCTQKIKGHTGWVKRLQYDDQILVTGSGDKTVQVRRWGDTTVPANTLKGHSDGVMGLRFMGNTIVSGSLDGTICVWDIDTGSCLNTIHNLDRETRHSEVRCLTFDQDDIIVSGGSDCTVKLWDLATGQLTHSLKGHMGYIKYVYLDDYKIVSGSADGTIRVWDYRGRSESSLYTITAHSRDIINMDVHENSFASGSLDDTMKMWVVE